MEATIEPTAQTDIVVRPVRDVDAEALGRVHATCWHETYDHLISRAALENVSPKRLAELWTHWAVQGPEFRMFAALSGGEIVGFVGSGPARDRDAPRARELYFIYLLDAFHGTGTGQRLFDAAVDAGEELYLWVAPARTASTRATASRWTARATPSRSSARPSPRSASSAEAVRGAQMALHTVSGEPFALPERGVSGR